MTVAPDRCPDELTAPVDDAPAIPDAAGIPAPESDAARVALTNYNLWLNSEGRDNRDKTRRLRAGQSWCAKRQ